MANQKRHLVVSPEPLFGSPAMRDLHRKIEVLASKDVTVTVLGESGVGKEVVARRLHELSSRARGPFVPINCAAIPEALFESELFGHERGAFTGAATRAKGKIEAAEGGTLLFDEVGEMPIHVQAKLLRFLENRKYMRVGGASKLSADVRLVFATLRPLEDDVEKGRFRADLYYRIHGVLVRVPPLRERRRDILPLFEAFVTELADRHGVPRPRVGRAIKQELLGYAWPGNVRELRNVTETIVLFRSGRAVRSSDLPLRRAARARPPSPKGRVGGKLVVDPSAGLERVVDEVVAHVVAKEQSLARAAEVLGLSLRTLQRYVARGRVRPPTG
jgi:transcriptional regulator with PAS, ATPase and Fis domain